MDQILFDAFQFAGIGRRNGQLGGPGLRRHRRRQGGIGKMVRQPIDRRFEVQVLEMDDQVNGAATAGAAVPVHELGAVDREHSLRGMPFVFVVGSGWPSQRGNTQFPREWPGGDRLVAAAARRSWFGGQFGTKADAAFHVDDMAVLGEPVDEGGGQMVVFEKGTPFGKAQIGSQEGGLFLVALMHQGKEQSDLDRFDLDVADFVDG
jgi:hypothetical protein